MASEDSVVIVSAVRTAIGSFLGSLSKLSGHQLGSKVISEALQRGNIPAEDVSEIIMGQVLLAGQGMNPARQAAFAAGVSFSVPTMNVSMVCGSGLRSVILGMQAIKCGDASVVVAGGQESMSQSLHAINLREGCKFGDKSLVDTMLKDGLTDAFHGYHMGVTAENVAQQWNVSREEQDRFSSESQLKATAAIQAGHFKKEIVAVSVPAAKKGAAPIEVDQDEFPKPDTTPEKLAKLRPAFLPAKGTVTAGNASGLNDGAAAVVLCTASEAARRGVKPLCRLVATATVGISPEIMGTGPIPAVKKALSKAGWSIDDVDLFELNEAFAAQSLAVMRDLRVDPSKVNISGGAIALGHPIGASGCRILVTLIHNLNRLGLRRGVASLCVGGGMGVAVCVERDD